MNRREFLKGAVAAGAVVPTLSNGLPALAEETKGLGRWRGWTPGEFQVHFIYTGVAESLFVIFPDGTTMLLDCGDIPAIMRKPYDVPVPFYREMAGETVANYVLRVNPHGKDVDYLVVSHFHADHTGTPCWQSCGTIVDVSNDRYCRSGFGIAAEKLRFAKAIDRGWPNYDDPIPLVDDKELSSVHMRQLYAYLKERDGLEVEKFRLGDGLQQFAPRHGKTDGFRIRNIAANGRVLLPDGTVRDLYRDYLAKHPECKALNENGMSLGMVFEYGKFRFYTAGDFSATVDGFRIEDAMAEALGGPVDVAKINHHGHRSMTPKLIAALRARCYVACIWDQYHVTDDTMMRLADRSLYPGERMFLPGILPKERVEQAQAAGKEWLKDVPESVRGKCSHIVLSVPAGGASYSLTNIDATDEEMRVRAEYRFG